jgi:DNA polymerase
MSLGREDVLRELELLPVWRLRTPVAGHALPAAEIPDAPSVSEVAPENNAEKTPSPLMTKTVTAPVTESVPAPPADVTDLPVETISAPLVESPWFLLCPQVADHAAQPLLESIVRALKLPAEELHVAQAPLNVTQVKSRFAILFGLEAANVFLGTNHADLASIRGRLLTHAEMRYVVTHHPQAMLEQPLLKKEAWHDLCLLLAEK